MFSIKYLILTVVFVVNIESKKFRPDYTYHQAIDGWLKLHVPGTWHDARERCHLEGAILASPVNENMRAALSSELNKSSSGCAAIYTGVHSIFSKGYFHSLEGEPLYNMSVPWLPGEPDNADNSEDCIAYSNGRVGDVNCSLVLPFVCYRRSTPDLPVMSCGNADKAYQLSSKTRSCYKLHYVKRTWAEAFKVCSAEGGYLVIINSAEEAAVLKGLSFSPYYDASTWVGIHDWNKDRTWRTVHGQTLEEAGYAGWHPGEPNNASPGEYCVTFTREIKLADSACERIEKFVCEKEPFIIQE